jgi:hypothetical protein
VAEENLPHETDEPSAPPVESPDEETVGERLEREYEEARKALQGAREKEPSAREDNELHIAQFQAQVAWLRLRWGHGGEAPHCPYCDTSQWEVDQPVYLTTAEGGKPLPMFPVICSNCGHTAFVASNYAGLLPDKHDDHGFGRK